MLLRGLVLVLLFCHIISNLRHVSFSPHVVCFVDLSYLLAPRCSLPSFLSPAILPLSLHTSLKTCSRTCTHRPQPEIAVALSPHVLLLSRCSQFSCCIFSFSPAILLPSFM